MRKTFFVIVLIALLCATSVTGQAEEGEEEQKNGSTRISTSVSVASVSQSDIRGFDASYALKKYSAELEWLFLFLNADHLNYDWDSDTSFLGVSDQDPWSSLSRIAPGAQYYRRFGGKWGIWARMEAISGFEERPTWRSWTYNPQLIGIYSPTEHLSLYCGAGILDNPTERVVYPVLGVAWNNDADRGLAFSLGFPETMARYRFNQRLALRLDFQWEIQYHRLSGENDLASKGYLRTKTKQPSLHLSYSPVGDLILDLGVTRYLGRSLSVYDRQGNKLASRDVSDSWGLSLGLEYTF